MDSEKFREKLIDDKTHPTSQQNPFNIAQHNISQVLCCICKMGAVAAFPPFQMICWLKLIQKQEGEDRPEETYLTKSLLSV